MADGVLVTAGSGTTIATDDLTGDGTVGGHVQLVKLLDGTDGGNTRALVGSRGLNVDPRASIVLKTVTPTVSTTPAYAVKDAVGGLMTFSNAARASGGWVTITAATVADRSQQRPNLDLLLFDSSISAPTDNSIFAPSDADSLLCKGIIQINQWYDFSTNSVASHYGLSLDILLTGTDLYGVLVNRSTPTFVATNDIVVALTIQQG